MSGSSNSNQVYEANMSTFRAFRATIDDLKNHPWAPYGDQASLVRRVQEWRKTIGHLTIWLQDVRAYYDQARPEIVSLLEFAFDSVSAVDKVRIDRTPGMLTVTDVDFINILRDYIRLIKMAFSPERQNLYSTPADQDPLQRGIVLYNGLHSFHRRLESIVAKRRPSAAQAPQPLSQPISPVTPTHPLQPVQNTQPPMHRGMSGNHVLPARPTQQAGAAPLRTHTHPNPPISNAALVRHPVPQRPQTNYVPLSQASQASQAAPQITWVQPVTQGWSSAQASPTVQQFPLVASTSQTVPVPPTPPAPAETATAMVSQDTETTEQDLPWGLTWEELEALDRSEWDAGTGNDESTKPSDENILPKSGPVAETNAPFNPIPLVNQENNAILDGPLVPAAESNQLVEQHVATRSQAPIIETNSRLVQSPVPFTIAKEESQSPGALLHTPPPPKILNKLERRQSQLAADVIDIEELSDDDSSISQPLMASARGAPPEAMPSNADIIDIDDSDEEDQIESEPVEPQTELSNQPHPSAASSPPNLSRPGSDNQATVTLTFTRNQPIQDVPAFANDAIPDAGSAADHLSGDAQPTPGMSVVLPGHKIQAPSSERPQLVGNQESPRPNENWESTIPSMKNESHDMDIDNVTDKPSVVQETIVVQQPPAPAEDVEMAGGEREIAPTSSALKEATNVNSGQVETSPTPMHSYESIKDAKEMPPDVLARIRQRAEEPLVTWYTASQPSMSREAAREKYKRMSDQEVFNLFLEVRPILGNLKVKVGAMNISAETLAGSPPSIDTTTPNRPSTGLKRSQPTHTPTAAETETPRKLARKPDSLAITVSSIQHEAPALLCVLPGTQGMSKSSLEFTVSAELVTSLKRWKARYLTPAGLHGELRTVELACYPPEAFYPVSEGGLLALTSNARTRTWPDGGLLRAFVNEGIRLKGQEVQFHLSPPVFTRIDESLDLSEFVQEGKNTIRFLHLGGMEKFVFVVQARRASPPVATWSTVLKRVQEFTENPGYQGLLARLSEKIK